MARFYETADPTFVDDAIFQPNLDLAKEVLLKKDGDISEAVQKLDVMRNLPIDYWEDADRENAMAVKQQYENRANEIAKQIQNGGLLNTGNNKLMINALVKDIEKDYEFGNIKKIQDNALAYRQFEEARKALTDPSARDAYSAMVNNYLKEANGQGAYYSKFTPDEMYDPRNILEDFSKSHYFKEIEADSKDSQIVKIGNRWVVKTGNSVEELSQHKLGKAFTSFIQAENLTGYGSNRQKYFNEQWTDAQGNLRYDSESYLGNLLANGIPALAYKKTKDTKDVQVNPYGQLDYAAALKKREAEEEARRLLAGANIDASNHYQYSKAVKEYEKNALTAYKEHFEIQDNKNINTLKDLYNYLASHPDHKDKTEVLAQIKSQYNNVQQMMKGSSEYLESLGYKPTEVQRVVEGLNKKQGQFFGTVPFQLLVEDMPKNEKGKPQKTKPTGAFKPNQYIGKTIYNHNGEPVKVAGVNYIENSIEPMLLNGPYNDKAIYDNDAVFGVTFFYENPKYDDSKEEHDVLNPRLLSFDRKAIFHLKDPGVPGIYGIGQ